MDNEPNKKRAPLKLRPKSKTAPSDNSAEVSDADSDSTHSSAFRLKRNKTNTLSILKSDIEAAIDQKTMPKVKLSSARVNDRTMEQLSDIVAADEIVHDKENILLLDDEVSILKVLKSIFGNMGYNCICSSDASEAIELITNYEFSLIMTDLRLGNQMDGLGVIETVKALKPDIPVILTTAYPSVSVAIKALKMGVFDLLVKPFKLDCLKQVVKLSLSNSGQYNINSFQQQDLKLHFGVIVGEEPKMIRLYSMTRRIAATDANVLIQGEAGTETELFAKAIQLLSKRSDKPFEIVDCKVLNNDGLMATLFVGGPDDDGVAYKANGGILLLEDLDQLDRSSQEYLLDYLKEYKPSESDVDIRFIFSSTKSLKKLVADGEFLGDLYYRICAFCLDIPALRTRVHDIPLHVNYFLFKKTVEDGVEYDWDSSMMNALLNYSWPSNLKELHDVLTYACYKCESDGILRLSMLPEQIQAGGKSLGSEVSGDNQQIGTYLRKYLQERSKGTSSQ